MAHEQFGELSDADRDQIRASVLALPPMTDEQIANVCEVIISRRLRHRADDP